MTPAEELHAAATKLRETADAVPQGTDDDRKDWAGQPWRTEECDRDCACIVYQGVYPDDPFKPVVPPIQYVADAETAEHATWVALAHPGLAEPLATWLEAVAGGWEQSAVLSPGASDVRFAAHPALAVARVINGGAR